MYTQRHWNLIAFGTVWLVMAHTILAVSAFAARAPTTFYVSVAEGNDGNEGLAPESAWASLERVRKERIVPGDKVRFRSGDHFIGQLVIDESGAPGAAVTFTAYGDGPKPVLDGGAMEGGAALATILLTDQDHIEIEGLEVRNFRKSSRRGVKDTDAYGILVQNTGKRSLRGFEFHNLMVRDVYPVKLNANFNRVSISGIRFETVPAKTKKDAVNTGDIYLHDNFFRHISRFGMSTRHRSSKNESLRDKRINYDVNVRITGNTCEDIGGTCALMNGVWNGLLEGNSFIRSGSSGVQPDLMSKRGSGAWFFRSRHIVAQRNIAVSSRGNNDTGGLHVDFGNKDILVQYNFFYDNEGYGTEILGKNENIIWRYNISVGDGTRLANVPRPDGTEKSTHPGKTIFVSDFSRPKRIRPRGVYIYNNTYVITKGSQPHVEINGEETHVWNNVFIIQPGGRLGEKVTIGWGRDEGVDIARNAYSGPVSPAFTAIDTDPVFTSVTFSGQQQAADAYMLPTHGNGEPIAKLVADFFDAYMLPTHGNGEELRGRPVVHQPFPAAGKGIFSHITGMPAIDFFGNPVDSREPLMGAGSSAP